MRPGISMAESSAAAKAAARRTGSTSISTAISLSAISIQHSAIRAGFHRTTTRSTGTACRCLTAAWCSKCPIGKPWRRGRIGVHRHGVSFVIEPCIRFEGKPGEQATMFLLDPTGNALEFKSFRNIAAQLFATECLPI